MPDTAPPSVTESWHRIDSWLREHAPASLGLLCPPAASEDVRRVEDAIGVRLPDEVAKSLAVHDGLSAWTDLLPRAAPLSAARIAEVWRIWTNEYDPADYDDDDVEEHWWNPLWIPWAETAGGDLHVVDLRPGPGHGRMGVAIHDDRGSFDDAWPGLGHFLHAVADAMWRGGEVEGLKPGVTAEGEVGWGRGSAP